MNIPKIIHQVWEGRSESKMPARLQIWARTWQENNPDWEYHLWDGKEMDQLVADYFPEYKELYAHFPYNVQRWDTIRYMILYVYGGVYADLDTECFQAISPLLDQVSLGFGQEPPMHADKSLRVGNAFMASQQQNRGWLWILEEIANHSHSLKDDSAISTVMHSTGSNMLARVFPKLQKELNAVVLPYQLVAPVSKFDVYNYMCHRNYEFEKKLHDAYCAHYFLGSWDSCLSLS